MANILTSLFESSPRKLAELMSLDSRPLMEWKLEELPSILKHQWAAPLHPDLSQIDPALETRLEQAKQSSARQWRCFADILEESQVPLEVLQILLDFAKASWTHPHRPMPQAIAQVMYYACIAKAWTGHQSIIGGLEERHVRRGIEWALSLPWLDEATRQVFAEARQRVNPAPARSLETPRQTPDKAVYV